SPQFWLDLHTASALSRLPPSAFFIAVPVCRQDRDLRFPAFGKLWRTDRFQIKPDERLQDGLKGLRIARPVDDTIEILREPMRQLKRRAAVDPDRAVHLLWRSCRLLPIARCLRELHEHSRDGRSTRPCGSPSRQAWRAGRSKVYLLARFRLLHRKLAAACSRLRPSAHVSAGAVLLSAIQIEHRSDRTAEYALNSKSQLFRRHRH